MRRRWRSALVLVLLVGISGAIAFAAVAGARRSASSLARFNTFSRPSDLEVSAGFPTPAQLAQFAHAPGVAGVGLIKVGFLDVDGFPNLKTGASVDGSLGSVVDRARLVRGRRPNPNVPDEVDIGEGLAAQRHVSVGDVLSANSVTPAQMQLLFQGKNPGPPAGPHIQFHIVGVVRRPLDLGDLAATGGVFVLTPAFIHTYTNRVAFYSEVLRVRTRRGARDIAIVSAEARRLFGASPVFKVSDVTGESRGAAQAIDVVTIALLVFALIAALASAVAIAIVLSREVSQSAADQTTLRSLGMTYRERIGALLPLPFAIAGVGAVLAMLGAVALSPLFPVGIARRADLDPGLHVDWLVLCVGAVVLFVFIMTLGLVASLRAARVGAYERAAAGKGARSVADLAARSGVRPTIGNGVRMAVQSRTGDATVPVRSAFVGSAFGVLGITALVVLGSSLAHLASTPRLYGWTFAFNAPDNTLTQNDVCHGDQEAALGIDHVAGVAAIAGICAQPIQVENRFINGYGFTVLRGTIGPEIITGRAPDAPDEIALGATTLRALGKHIGDSVHATAAGHTGTYRIVGKAVIPRINPPDVQPLADGAIFTGGGLLRIADPANASRYVVGQDLPGASRATVLARINALPNVHVSGPDALYVSDNEATSPVVPPEISRLRQLGWFGPTLAVLLATLAVVAVGHAIVTGTRRRRHELALLKTLGFQRAQVRATIGWQATTIAAIGALVGVPAGILVGRVAWQLLTNGLGIAAPAATPAFTLTLVVGAGIAVVNLIAAVPARAAANLRPAIALRSE